MLQVGEKVRYLDDVGEATIIRFLDEDTALVEDEYGLSHPHPLKKLVPAERDHVAQQPTKPKPKPKAEKPIVEKFERKEETASLPELCLAFVSSTPAKPETGDLEVFFCNQSNYSVLVNISAKENEEWFSVFNGEVKAGGTESIQSLRRQDVGLLSNLMVDVLFFRTTGYKYRKPISCSAKIKVTRFVKPGNYIRYTELDNPAVMVAIESEKSVPAPSFSASKKPVTTKNKPSLPVFEEEVDLHLDKILGHEPTKMSDHEKFLTQMRHFERRLNNALTHRYIQITFIHGVGTGRLKEAIRAELKEYGLPYTDGSYQKYGVGATVVQLN